MNKLHSLLFAICLIPHISICAQKSSFAQTADIRLGYKNEVLTTTLGYDLGYNIKNSLYIGVGPMGAASVGPNNYKALAAGGYGKVRFTLPLRTSIKPFLQGNCGYSYNFKSKGGGMLYGGAVGIKIKDIALGVYCDISSNTFTSETTSSYYVQHYHRRNLNDPKPYTGSSGEWRSYTSTDSKTEWNIVPCLLLGFDL